MKIAGVLIIVGLILLVIYPKECGYNFTVEKKECQCLGYMKEGKIDLCYGFCKNCACSNTDLNTGNISIVECE